MTEHEWSEWVDAYVLGALTADERADFEAAMASSPDLKAQVAAARVVAAELAEALPDVSPPPELKAELLARVRSEGEERRTRADGIPSSTSGPSAEEAQATSTSGGASVSPTRISAPWLLLAASVAGLAWLGLENAALTEDAGRMAAELEEIRVELGEASVSLARLDSLSQAVSGPGVRFATLSGDDAPALRLVWNPDRALLLVAASNLPAPTEGRTYQLWGIDGSGAAASLGVFDTGSDGSALVTLGGVAAADYVVSAVTDEPTGGSPQPTTTPFLVGSWGGDDE